MKLLYIADGRSPIAINWISYFVQGGHEVHLASTFACKPLPGLASLSFVPVPMSGSYGSPDIASAHPRLVRKFIPVRWRTKIRQWLAPWTLPQAAKALRQVIERIQPDLIHAMRIPYEGMAAAMAMANIDATAGKQNKHPFLISVWGNDFTLHAKSSSSMETLTRRALQACDGLHADCRRDLRLAGELGFSSHKPAVLLPGGGGINFKTFFPAEVNEPSVPGVSPMEIINPRGIRAYVRNDTFFHAIPRIVEKFPEISFVCPGMAGEKQAQSWVDMLPNGEVVRLLPVQSQVEMAGLFRRAQISVSITEHDGTPNSLLEAMACGCFPIAGDIESLREWITMGENGLLVDPGDPRGLAEAIIRVISEPDLRRKARDQNLQLVRERGEYMMTMRAAEEFYEALVEGREVIRQ